jgi:hypothetical protein
MVVGVTRRPEHGFLPAAVGLLGKVLGPIGMLHLVVIGAWPLAAVVSCVTHDLVWWVPFGLYLRDAWRRWRGTWVARP